MPSSTSDSRPCIGGSAVGFGAPSLFLAAGNRLLRSGCSYCSGETVESNRKTVLDTVTILSVTLKSVMKRRQPASRINFLRDITES